MNEKIKSLFEDLGKPTLRGIRKCPKCGTYNGTRGMTCKNKSCKAVFKEAKEPPKTQAVKIISSESQIYSVKVQDKNPDMWGFVQLPLIEGLSLLQRTPEVELIFQSAAQCYVESCQKSNEDIPELSLSVNTCQHVSAALSTTREAKQLVVLKNTVFNLLPISKEMKEELWKLITETPQPLIQRISKNCMVIKCKPDSQHPLGFLHVRIYNRHNRGSAFRYRMICDCESFELSKARFWKNDNHCIHYYACMSAFASDKKLSKEFKGFLMMANIDKPAIQNVHVSSPKRKISILESAANDSEIALKILLIDEVHTSMKKKENSSGSNSNFLLLQDRKTESWMLNDSFAKTLSDTSKKRPGKFSTLAIDESSVALSFISWLASVTERINQTMHFQFDGKPDPLVFHVPQMFFDCLQQRIPSGSKRKSLPHMTCTFERKDALPLGKFSKYTWNICDLLHVKEIFDTPEIALQVTQSFVENRDGTYDPYSPSTDGEQLAEHYKKTGNNLLIKPLELKTFLKVGQVSPDSEEEVPFIIEWIPNLLPKSNIGELHIKFEFGHMRNGRVVIGGPVLFIQELLT